MKTLSRLALACKQAYSDKTFSSGDVEVLYKPWNGRHIYAIRGTETQLVTRGGIIDLLRSLMFWRKDEVHYGYHEAWEAISKDLLDHYHAQQPGALILTGHSYGGAVAIIGTLDLLEAGGDPKSIGCVTFGAPRCIDLDDLDLSLRGKLHECCMEVVHSRDPIPSAFRFAGFDWADRPNYVGGIDRAAWYKMRMKYHDIESYQDEIEKEGH